ncbi:MAG: NUDIX domain-containing protein [Gemmatimonadota bacterium]
MIKRSIALVIREPEGSRAGAGCGPARSWLLVRRPDDDADLPGVWGLPAGTLDADETAQGLVRRIGRGKLGIEVEPGAVVATGAADRAAYRLDMELWTATILDGVPNVEASPVHGGDQTRYAAWKWDDPSALEEGAREGSLCCRLGVELARGF